MYDPQQEDIWETAIRAAESVAYISNLADAAEVNGKPESCMKRDLYAPPRICSRRLTQREKEFNDTKLRVITALRRAQRESVERRYPLTKHA